MFGLFFSDSAKELFGVIGNLPRKFILSSNAKTITHTITLNFI